MTDKLEMDVPSVELNDDELDGVVGGFTEGETLMLKSGRTACTVCGMRNITNMVTAAREELSGWQWSLCPADIRLTFLSVLLRPFDSL